MIDEIPSMHNKLVEKHKLSCLQNDLNHSAQLSIKGFTFQHRIIADLVDGVTLSQIHKQMISYQYSDKNITDDSNIVQEDCRWCKLKFLAGVKRESWELRLDQTLCSVLFTMNNPNKGLTKLFVDFFYLDLNSMLLIQLKTLCKLPEWDIGRSDSYVTFSSKFTIASKPAYGS